VKNNLRLLIPIICLILVTSLFVSAEPEAGSWIRVSTEHFVVHFWKDLPEDRFAQTEYEYLDEYFAQLQAYANSLEKALAKVEALLGVAYDLERGGKVYVFIYPSLEVYQEEVGCLICAAHVGRLPFPPEEAERLTYMGVNPIAAFLNLDSEENVILHELTHIVDFSMIENFAPVFLYEGLASYVGYKLDGIEDRWQFGLRNQYLKLFLADHRISLKEQFQRPRYAKFTYDIGTSFIDFLVRRGSMEQFMAFYRELYSLEIDKVDQLFQEHYDQTLDELEQAWKDELAQVEITEEGLAAYEFRMDQIVVRYMFLRELIRDKERLKQAFENLWPQGRFNFKEAEFMRRYLQNPANFIMTSAALAKVRNSLPQLRSYVYMYSDDAQIKLQFEEEFKQLIEHWQQGRYDKFRELYIQMVHHYISWRI